MLHLKIHFHLNVSLIRKTNPPIDPSCSLNFLNIVKCTLLNTSRTNWGFRILFGKNGRTGREMKRNNTNTETGGKNYPILVSISTYDNHCTIRVRGFLLMKKKISRNLCICSSQNDDISKHNLYTPFTIECGVYRRRSFMSKRKKVFFLFCCLFRCSYLSKCRR